MKKIFCLIAVLMLMSACDDGDMDFKTFDFSNQLNPTPCASNTDTEITTEIYWKINGTEGLILELPKGTLINSPTKDPVTGEDDPREIVLGGSNKLTYQDYVSVPTALCTVAQIPAVNETWNGEGTLLVSTIPNYKLVDGVQKLKGYIHTITMLNVSFKHDDQTITVINSVFGDIIKDNGFDFNFIADGGTEPIVKSCTPGISPIYTLKSTQTLSISVANFGNIFPNTTGTQSYTINGPEGISIFFNVYKNSATTANVCGQGGDVPSQPIQRWFAQTGTITVITSETGGVYSHDIYLKDTRFANNQNDTFDLDDVATVTEENGYFFGTYQ